jgi:nucleoid-associated protein YgaU
MTRRRRRRRRRASSRFPFEGEGRRRGEDAVAPRDARLRCGSGEEGETTPERRRGWGTRVGGSSSRRPKKNRLLYMGSLFRRFQKPFFMDLASRGARFQSADFPSPKSRTASALRSTGVLQSRTPYNLRSIAPPPPKKSASAGRVKARAVRSRAHESARRGIDLETRAARVTPSAPLARAYHGARTRTERNARAPAIRSLGRSISLEGYSEPSGGVPR